MRNESKRGRIRSFGGDARSTDFNPKGAKFEYEHICRDPKDGELCLKRVKPGETLVEARSGSDVQIDRHSWV